MYKQIEKKPETIVKNSKSHCSSLYAKWNVYSWSFKTSQRYSNGTATLGRVVLKSY